LIALGFVGWLLLRRRRKAGAGPENQATDRLRSWIEAACPGCLAATAIERSLEKAPSE
jgi:hypothetical protein